MGFACRPHWCGQSAPPPMFKLNLVGGGSIAVGQGRAGESRSRHNRACACAQMEIRDNLIRFNCLLIWFRSISELWLGSLRMLGSRIVNAANMPFLL